MTSRKSIKIHIIDKIYSHIQIHITHKIYMYEVYEIVGSHVFFSLDSIYLVCDMEYKDESLDKWGFVLLPMAVNWVRRELVC